MCFGKKIENISHMKKLVLYLFLVIGVMSCKKEKENNDNPPATDITDINQLVVPPGFNYQTSSEVGITVTLKSNDDKPLKGVRVDLMDKTPEDGGKIFYTGTSDANGVMNIKVELPLYVKELVVNTDYIGLTNNVLMSVNNGSGSIIIGGSDPKLIRTAGTTANAASPILGKNTNKLSYRLGNYTKGANAGVPAYLEPTNDALSQTFLDDINASLPERQPVPTFRPQYLAANIERNLVLTEQCDVWITFVHEGAGYRNSLFYFVYNKNNKPTTIAQVDSFIAIFPNASLVGSGGGLVAGNKVKIGRFGADTAIGFALAPNGWNGNNVNGNTLYTSIRSMNPETNDANKEHVVLLFDNPTKRFLIGFEDLNRNPGNGSDDDFNDCIVYATANPVQAIQTNNVLPTTPSVDADNDGVNDTYDEYPNDNQRAFNVYYPSVNGMASVAFEDLWPSKGDYDLNDVVVDFQYHAVTNGSNQIKDLNAKYKLRAAGGVFKNGFSIELPFNRSNVTVNSGTNISGLESQTTTAIFNVLANTKNLIGTYNTLPDKPFVNTDTLYAKITLTTAQTATIGTFNPFIYIDEPGKGRGYEVHLPGKTPTTLVNNAVLGTNADATNPGTGVYYKTSNGLPFAIATPEAFFYPWEKTQIIHAHKKFAAWAQSGGNQFADWYKAETDYRDNSKIYTKP